MNVQPLDASMKLVAEYLDHAQRFERMAEEASDPQLKAQFLQQGQAYRKLAAKRVGHLKGPTSGVSEPKPR